MATNIVKVNLESPRTVDSIAALEALNVSRQTGAVYLDAGGRSGWFKWNSSDLSTQVTADPEQGIYVAPSSDPTGASGAWVRDYAENGIFPKWFGAVGDGVADDTTALQACANAAESFKTIVLLGSGTFDISDTVTFKSSVIGLGIEDSVINMTSSGTDAIHFEENLDYFQVSRFHVNYGPAGTSTGNGFTWLNNNHNCVTFELQASDWDIGFEWRYIAWFQNATQLRAIRCNTGMRMDGISSGGVSAGTTIVVDQFYSQRCGVGIFLDEIASVTLRQPTYDMENTTAGITALGVGELNIYDAHFEGSPGVDGKYISYTTLGSFKSGLNVFGGIITQADVSSNSWNVFNIQGVDDDVYVNIHGFGSRSFTTNTSNNNLFSLANSSGSTTYINWMGSDIQLREFDISSLNGAYRFRDFDQDAFKAPVYGVETVAAGGSVATGLNGTPKVLINILRNDDNPETVFPVVSNRFSNGSFKVRYTTMSTGVQDTGASRTISWVAWL